ncbi:MAG: hypothetical protein RLZZ241_1996 [Bacteroidota bacterium]
MKPYRILFSLLSFVFLFLNSCNDGPKVVEPTGGDVVQGAFSVNPSIQVSSAPASSMGADLHQVVAEEVLEGSRYVFVKVREGVKSKWISTRLREVVPGQMYYYRGGLLKTNFESLEFKRNFDTLYLISSLVDANHSQIAKGIGSNLPQAQSAPEKVKISTHGEPVNAPLGTITIAELVKNAAKYEGQTVQVHGTCIKINPNIMQRNWIHLRDGTQDDYDLVITSVQYIAEGTTLTMSATVTLKKDFGAGYYYDLILENGVLIP